MKSAEQFFRDKAFPVGIDDTAWELWKRTHSGIAWQGFAIKAMEEYKLQFEKELVDFFRQHDIDEIERIERIIKCINEPVLAVTPNEVQK